MFKKLLPVIAILLVFAMISPGIMAAELNQNETVIDAPSEHTDDYDEVVNIADESSIQNPDTWYPGYEGIWVGSSTEESLFQFSDVTYGGAHLGIAYEVEFSRNQIMSGVAEFTMRLPIYNTNGSLWKCYLQAYQLADDATYSWITSSGSGYFDSIMMNIGGYYKGIGGVIVDVNDTSYSDGGPYWTNDGRTYVHMVLPLFPDLRYLFSLNIYYGPDAKFSLYLSPQDIVSDGKYNTSTARWNYDSSLDGFQLVPEALPVDCGFSFDLQAGMGGGIYGKRFSLEAGDEVEFATRIDQTGTIDGYHNIMMPFLSDEPINVSLAISTYYYDPYGGVEDFTIDALNYKDYILVSSGDSSIDDTITTTSDFEALITITFNEPTDLMFYFTAEPFMDFIGGVTVDDVAIKMDMWCSYQVAANVAVQSNDITSGAPINPLPETLDPWTILGSLVFTLLFPAVALQVAFYDTITGGDSVAGWLFRQAGDFLYAGAKYIAGLVINLIDSAWNFLKSIGDFLWSIGEFIWDALTWLAEQIVEYGAIILGLLIIGVSLMLFFVPIYAQLKLWGIVWSLAEGDLKAATNQAQDLASTASSAAGKIKGLI